MLRTIAQRLRHTRGLEGRGWLWNLVRTPYHRVLGVGGRGAKASVAGALDVRMPVEFCGASWEKYEPEGVRAVVNWVRSNPGCLVLDVGCSIGIYSLVSLFADTAASVIAFDSDLNSLAATRRMCCYAQAADQRLSVIHGLITNIAATPATLSEAVNATQLAITEKQPTGSIGTTQYLCLTSDEILIEDVPRYSLDTLLEIGRAEPPCRPVLLKCDVEGAEFLVLCGAKAVLTQVRPHLLLSVHPLALPAYSHSVAQIETFLHE